MFKGRSWIYALISTLIIKLRVRPPGWLTKKYIFMLCVWITRFWLAENNNSEPKLTSCSLKYLGWGGGGNWLGLIFAWFLCRSAVRSLIWGAFLFGTVSCASPALFCYGGKVVKMGSDIYWYSAKIILNIVNCVTMVIVYIKVGQATWPPLPPPHPLFI